MPRKPSAKPTLFDYHVEAAIRLARGGNFQLLADLLCNEENQLSAPLRACLIDILEGKILPRGTKRRLEKDGTARRHRKLAGFVLNLERRGWATKRDASIRRAQDEFKCKERIVRQAFGSYGRECCSFESAIANLSEATKGAFRKEFEDMMAKRYNLTARK